MSIPLRQGDGPSLGPCPTGGTEMLDPSSELKMRFPQAGQGNLLVNFKSLKMIEKLPKHFNDGPALPLSPSQMEQGDELTIRLKAPNLNVSKKGRLPLLEDYVPGSVKQTNRTALEKLADDINTLPKGSTGAIVEEGFEPTGDQYVEGYHYIKEKKVSNGSFGSGDMCIGIDRSGHNPKRFFRKTMSTQNFRSSEVTVPINLKHENVTKLYGMIHRQEENSDSIVELMMEPAGMALNTYVQNETVETPRIWDVTRQTMAGLNHMHYYGMIHFDIKPENICITVLGSKCVVKITDFGSSKLPKDKIEFVGWTPEYMCRETSLLFLQKSEPTPLIQEEEITGKVDVFAGALVIMYMYERVHVLQRLITNGKSSYKGYNDEERKNLQLNLLKMLAEDPNIIPLYIVPDACDIDMRELIGNMTQFNHQNRFTAEEVINFIDKRDKRKREAILECQKKLQIKKIEKDRIRESATIDPFVNMVTEIPEIAFNCLDTENGPIKLATKHKLQQKLKPYGGKGKGKGKMMMAVESPVVEMRRIEAASKKMDDYMPPATPVTEVSLSLARLKVEKPKSQTERKAQVTQPMADNSDAHISYIHSRSSIQPVTQDAAGQAGMVTGYRPINNKVLPPKPYPATQPTPQARQTIQKANNLMAVMQMMLNKGLVGIKVTDKGPQLVPTPQAPVVRTGVTPFMPASPPQPNLEENMEDLEETGGNVPDFMKLG